MIPDGIDINTCQCPHGLIPHFYTAIPRALPLSTHCVNALTGLYLISTPYTWTAESAGYKLCQCPHGLIPHFYVTNIGRLRCVDIVSMPSRAYTSFLLWARKDKDLEEVFGVNALTGLYLISTTAFAVAIMTNKYCVNALTGLYLISTVPLQKPRFYAVSRACFCRYLSEYSDSNCFSCMLTIWTYLTRYTHL